MIERQRLSWTFVLAGYSALQFGEKGKRKDTVLREHNETIVTKLKL